MSEQRATEDLDVFESHRPALVFYRDHRPFAAVLLAVAEGRIQRVFFHADPDRLRHLGRGPVH